MKHIDLADERIEQDKMIEVVEKQPKQSQAVLFSIICLLQNDKRRIETGEVYEKYVETCRNVNLPALTQRRVSDLLGELDMLGIINAKVISKGRHGRTREIYMTLPSSILEKIKDMLSQSLV